jgi:LmbE family N-acetylglucosaminyl deacetylase/SAM-dependent methyltransferase
VVTFSHTDDGTDEAAWVDRGLPVIPELPLSPPELAAMRFVVLAAHPDDETLGAGGLLAHVHALGAHVEVLLCTAGEGSHPDSPTVTPDQLAGTRLEEFAAGLASLGLEGRWRCLGYPDRGLGAHAAGITSVVREAVRRLPGDPGQLVLVAPYRQDGHADHDVLGQVAAEVARQGGHGLLEYPVWFWHWATPDNPAWQAWVRFHPDPPALAAKARAMDAHATQVRPLSPAAGDEVLLSEAFLKHFSRGYEVFAWTPPAQTSGAPHRSADAERIFDAVHARAEDPWDYLGSWYERRKRALTLAALPRESYESGLEVGCSIGTLTAGLAPRCRSLLAVDASSTALDRAAARLAPFPGVTTRQLTLPGSWPGGSYDLVVVSEVGYYLGRDELGLLLDRVVESMMPGGTLLLCHWRHPIQGWELDGETVHTLVRDRLGWPTAGLYRERDFVLETLMAPAAAVAS